MRQTCLVLCKCISTLAATVLLSGSAGAFAPPPPYPVIFIPGFSADACAWRDLTERLVFEEGWRYGGEYLPDQTGSVSLGDKDCLTAVRPTAEIRADFYLVSFSSPEILTLRQQGFELTQVIERVLRRTGQDRVILVGWSMGGLAARAHLEFSAHPGAPKVQHLITFGTPHLGSDLARRCRQEWEVVCRVVGRDPNGAAVRTLVPGSDELNELNAAASQLPATTLYTSIVVRGRVDLFGDGAVSDQSQNLANVPLVGANRWDIRHRAVEIRMASACNPLSGEFAPHQCEPEDRAVQEAVLNAVGTDDVSIELTADRREISPGETVTVSLQLHPQRPQNMRALYVGVQRPDGSLVFQRGLEQNFTWSPELAPARALTPLLDRDVITAAALAEDGASGPYVFAALLVEPGQNPTDRNNWRSNITLIALTVGARTQSERALFLYAASKNSGPTTPAKLWQVEPWQNGRDVLVGTFRTSRGMAVEIVDLTLTPAGELFGISRADPSGFYGESTDRQATLYRIDPATAIVTRVGPLGEGYFWALASDSTGGLYAAGEQGLMLGGTVIVWVSRRSGQAVPIARLGGALGDGGVSGDLAVHPTTGELYITMASGPFGWQGDELLAINLTQNRFRHIGFLGVNDVTGLAFVGNDLCGITAGWYSEPGRLVRIDPETGQTQILRALGLQASGAALQAAPQER